jgi:hypothetical protein
MTFAPVPEAAVHKDGDSPSSQDDVRAPVQAGYRPTVHKISDSGRPELPTKQDFACSISARLQLHSTTYRCSRGESHAVLVAVATG